MNFEYRDFIGVFSDVFPEGFCEHLITEFNRNKDLGAGSDRQKGEGVDKHFKNDYQICSNGKNINFEPFNDNDTRNMFFKGLQHCFDAYAEEFSPLKNTKINCNNMKMQETSTGGGYHVWHSEQGNGALFKYAPYRSQRRDRVFISTAKTKSC